MKIYKLNNDFNYSNIELSQPKGVQEEILILQK